MTTHINCLVYGPTGGGKSTYLARLATGETKETTHTKVYATTKGSITLHFTEATSLTVEMKVDGVVLMVKKADKNFFTIVDAEIAKIRTILPTTPIVLCGTMVDTMTSKAHLELGRTMNKAMVRHIIKHNLVYYDLSSLSDVNIDKPVLCVIRRHFKTENVGWA